MSNEKNVEEEADEQTVGDEGSTTETVEYPDSDNQDFVQTDEDEIEQVGEDEEDLEPEQEDYDEISEEKLSSREEKLNQKIDDLEALETAGTISEQDRLILEQCLKERDSEPVKRKTSRKWWDDLINSKLDANSCIFELVDNSVGHIRKNVNGIVPLNVDIILTEDDDDQNKAKSIEIRDNASGIQRDQLDAVLSLWGKTGEHDDENISEHGCGMKYGIRGLGREVSIITKVKELPLALKMTTEDILSMDTVGFRPELVEVDFDHGTVITITELEDQGKNLAKATSRDMFHDYLKKSLGCRYQLMLSNIFDSENENCGLRLVRKLANGNDDIVQRVTKVAPVYYCSRENAAQESLRVELEDPRGEWKVSVTAGEYPDFEDEDGEMSVAWKDIESTMGSAFVSERRVSPKMHNGDPYKRTDRNAGFDIIRRGIVVERGFLHGPEPYRIGEISQWSNDYNPLIGQIKIERGFKTGTQKTGITRDRHFEELCTMLTRVLYGEESFTTPSGGLHRENFIGTRIRGSKPKHKTEEELDAGLVEKLKDPDGIHPSVDGTVFPEFIRKDIFRQVWSGPGRADILINDGSADKDTVVVEVKKGKAIGKDVYQLLMYMQEHETKWGILAAEDKMDGVDQALKNIEKNYNKKLWGGNPAPVIFFWNLESNPVKVPSDLNKYTRENHKQDNPDNLINGKLDLN